MLPASCRALAAVVLTLASCLSFAAPTPQFFSYYGLGDHFAEARDHVNLYWVVSWSNDRGDVKAQLREARSAGVNALLHPEFLFFEGSCPARVRSDAAARWRAFATELAAEQLLDAVVAVYPLDEPDLCGVPDADVQDVVAMIRDEPLTRDKKVAALFTVDVAKRWGGHYRLTHREHEYAGSLRAFDWVGFDCYGCDSIYTETAWDTVRFDSSKPGFVTVPGPTLYENFKSQLDLARQQIIIAPKASIGGPVLGDRYDDPALHYWNASGDPDVILLAPFTWFDQEGGIQGVRSNPALRAAYAYIGRDIDARHPEVSPTFAPRASAVEFYHTRLDHYFVSADQGEIARLDAGELAGWTRTGERFNVFVHAPGMAARGSPVCRFYGRPEAGLDSHFYTASHDECAAVGSRFGAAWLLESDDVFEAQLPNPRTGTCPLAMRPVYRLYDARPDANHRFMTSLAIQQQMVTRGWISEGYGAAGVALCVPH